MVRRTEGGVLLELGPDSLPLVLNRRRRRDQSTWLPAALLATLTLLAGALQAFGGESQLEWRRAEVPAARNAKAPTQPQRKPQQLRPHRTQRIASQPGRYRVVQAAYNADEGWSTTADEGPAMGSARLDSVVVHSDAGIEADRSSHRVAQDPFEDDQFDEGLSRDITEPFGEQDLPDAVPDTLPDGPEAEDLPEPIEPTLPEMDDEPELEDPDPFEGERPTQPDPTQPEDREPAPTPIPQTFEPLPGRDGTPESEESFEQRQDLLERSPAAASRFEEERERVIESCEEERARMLDDRIADIDLSMGIRGREGLDYPFECVLDDGTPYAGRTWPEVTYMWKAAANYHRPLYFEQHHLERYGHSWGPCVQPLVSGAHFFTRLPVLPYCMGITPPNECLYPLGYYRPGNCAPYMVDPIPFSWRAALFQAGATVGTAAILP